MVALAKKTVKAKKETAKARAMRLKIESDYKVRKKLEPLVHNIALSAIVSSFGGGNVPSDILPESRQAFLMDRAAARVSWELVHWLLDLKRA